MRFRYGRVCACPGLHWGPRLQHCARAQPSAASLHRPATVRSVPRSGRRGLPAAVAPPSGHGALPHPHTARECQPACLSVAFHRVLRSRLTFCRAPHRRTRLLAGPRGSHPSCCYSHQDLHCGCLHMRARACFCGARTPPYYANACGASGRGCSAIHFRGGRIRQVRCNTLLSGCRLLWPPPCCLDSTTPFRFCAPRCGPLAPHQVHPSSPALLTSAGPRGAPNCARLHC